MLPNHLDLFYLLKTNWQHFAAWQSQHQLHSLQPIPHLLRHFFLKSIHHLPIYTGNIYHYINHVTAQLIGLHVHRGTVCCNVDFADYVEEESFFNAWILQKEKEFGLIFKITAFLKSQVEVIHFHILSSRKLFEYKQFRGLRKIQDLEHILYKYNTLVVIVHINLT